MDPGSAASAGGPAPGQYDSQFSPVQPSRHAHVSPSSRPVHTCISAPDFRRVTRASPHAHVGEASSLTMLQSSPSKPGLQWHVPSRASHLPRSAHGAAALGPLH